MFKNSYTSIVKKKQDAVNFHSNDVGFPCRIMRRREIMAIKTTFMIWYVRAFMASKKLKYR